MGFQSWFWGIVSESAPDLLHMYTVTVRTVSTTTLMMIIAVILMIRMSYHMLSFGTSPCDKGNPWFGAFCFTHGFGYKSLRPTLDQDSTAAEDAPFS